MVLVPYLAGERTPNRPEASGSLHGIRPDVTPALVARAAFEGVVCGLLDGVDALAAAGVPRSAGRTIVLGGGAASAAYTGVLAGLSGRPVSVAGSAEPVARGAGILAATVAPMVPSGVASVIDAWNSEAGTTVAPGLDPEQAEAIRRRYAVASAQDEGSGAPPR